MNDRKFLDVGFAILAFGSWFETHFTTILSAVATIMAIVWYALQIYGYWKKNIQKDTRKKVKQEVLNQITKESLSSTPSSVSDTLVKQAKVESAMSTPEATA